MVLAAVTVLPSFFLVGALSKVPPPVAGLDWVKANRPTAILYSGSLRHAAFYWPEGETLSEPKTMCGIEGVKRVVFKRDTRIHDKHHFIPIFEYDKSAGSPG